MVAVTVPPPTMTADDFAEFVDRPENAGRWWELDRGRVIEMPPPKPQHGTVCGWVAYHLWSYAIRRGRGRVTTNDTGLIVEQNPDTVRGVDIMFFDESVPLTQITRRYEQQLPVLVVEVWSPSDRRNQMNRRVAQYMARGIPIVWLVDPDDLSVAVHRPGVVPVVAEWDDELTGFDLLPDFRCKVADLFTLPGQPPAAPAQP
jgi:Uma2 family endonuclease